VGELDGARAVGPEEKCSRGPTVVALPAPPGLGHAALGSGSDPLPDPPFTAYRPAFRARPVLRRGAGASSSGYLRKVPSWLNGSRRSDFKYAAIRGRSATRSRSATRRGIFRSSRAIAFGNA